MKKRTVENEGPVQSPPGGQDDFVTGRISRRTFGQLLGMQAALVSTVTLAGCVSGSKTENGTVTASAMAGSQSLKRGVFVAMIADYFNWVHSSEYTDIYKAVQPTFVDVTLNATPYARQIETALEESLISNAQGYFYPEALITREDAADIYLKAFKIPLSPDDALAGFSDATAISRNKQASVNAMVAAGYMQGVSTTRFSPTGTLSGNEAKTILTRITSSRVAPPQVMCKPGTTAPRRYVSITTPTPGATIYYTFSFDGTEPADPLSSAGKIYDFTVDGVLQFVNPLNSSTDSRFYRLKAVAKKDGLATSAIQEFGWNIVRPQMGAFQAKLVQMGTATTPTIWKINNAAEYFQANVYYIEGTRRGLVFDAGEYSYQKANLKTFIDSLATKPYDIVLGHSHPDHAEQVYNFTSAGVTLYLSAIEKAGLIAANRKDFQDAGNAAVAISDGQVLDLGNAQITIYQIPGHTNGLSTIIINQTGWVYGSDMWGCNRPHTADTTQYQGVKVDLFLSLVQQILANYRKSSISGEIAQITNAHQETPVGMECIRNFEKCFQQLIDEGNSIAKPSIRGGSKGGDRMSMVGDMWRDKNWIAIGPIGKYASPVDYFTKPTTAYPCGATLDYNTADGFRKYSVLSNIEIDGGTLVGVDIFWAAPVNGIANTQVNKFDPWTYNYRITVPAATRSIMIGPTAMSSKVRSMAVNGTTLKQGTTTTVAVSDGSKITVDIVSPDGASTSNYIFTISAV